MNKLAILCVIVLTIFLLAIAPSCAQKAAVEPTEDEAVGGVAPSEEAAGVPAEEEAAGEAAVLPSPEAVSVDIELKVDSTNPEGTRFIAPESGSYEITIVGGAYRYLPEEDPNWAVYGGWRTVIGLYINRPVEWGGTR